MFDKSEGTIYCVTDLGNGMLFMIDEYNYRIIKEVQIGPRPHSIIVDEENSMYIASDRNSKITYISDFESIKAWDMPNNGNVQVDLASGKLYVCNADEITVYKLYDGEKLTSITGFTAADCLKLNKNKSKLFVLDILQNELKIYDTINYNLTRKYKNIGIRPAYIFISEDEGNIYIANKGTYTNANSGNISILNLEKGSISYVNFPKGSSITYLECSGNVIYAVNQGLHQVEVIDIVKRERKAVIKTSLQEPQRICLSPNKKVLLITNRNLSGKGALDRVEVSTNTLVDTIIFQKENSIPFDIATISINTPQIENEAFILSEEENKVENNSETAILAKKVISTYHEKKIFSEVEVKLPFSSEDKISLENIIFKQCKMISGTEKRENLSSRKDYSILEYGFQIPYLIKIKNSEEESTIIEGLLEGKQKATVFIPEYLEQFEIQFVTHAFIKLTDTPVMLGNILNFTANALISTKVIVEDIIFIPSYKNSNWWLEKGSGDEVGDEK